MASGHPDLELNQILSFKEDLHSLAAGESEVLASREVMYDGGRGRSGRTRAAVNRKLRIWAESFRRDPKGRMTPNNAFVGGRDLQGRNYFDLRAANYRTAHPLLAKELKGRHLQMIAIGGSIGESKTLLSSVVCFASARSPHHSS